MAKINDGGPAFPGTMYGQTKSVSHPGMDLRDWFAGQALASMGGRLLEAAYEAGASRDRVPDDIAIVVYGLADAMLAERAKGGA